MSNPPIPNLPPLSAISDPATREYLQLLTNGWQVRNGQIGNGDEKFLTVKDLTDGIAMAAGTRVTNVGSGRAATAVSNAFKEVKLNPTSVRLLNWLHEKINLISLPDWFNGQFGAAVKTVKEELSNAISALARQTTLEVAKVDNNVALVQHQTTAIAEKTNAHAEDILQLQAEVLMPDGTPISTVVQQVATVAANTEGALSATWGVKMNANYGTEQYATGFALGLDANGVGATSSFAVSVDQFVLANPRAGTGTVAPFVVQTSDMTDTDGNVIPAGVYIPDAFIKNGSIGSAKIGNIISSANYLAGQTGWIIRKNGSAEFNGDVVINGKLTNRALNDVLKTSVVTGYVNISEGWPATVVHNLGRPALVIITNPILDGIMGEKLTAHVSDNNATSFSISVTSSNGGEWGGSHSGGSFAYVYL